MYKIFFNCKKSTHDLCLYITTNLGYGVKCTKNKYNIFISIHLFITEVSCNLNAYLETIRRRSLIGTRKKLLQIMFIHKI